MKFSDTAVVSLMTRSLLCTPVLLQRHELRQAECILIIPVAQLKLEKESTEVSFLLYLST